MSFSSTKRKLQLMLCFRWQKKYIANINIYNNYLIEITSSTSVQKPMQSWPSPMVYFPLLAPSWASNTSYTTKFEMNKLLEYVKQRSLNLHIWKLWIKATLRCYLSRIFTYYLLLIKLHSITTARSVTDSLNTAT